MKKLALIGNGGHSRVIRDSILAGNEFTIIGILDDKIKQHYTVDGIHYAPVSYAHQLICTEPEVMFVIGIGANKIRKQIVEQLRLPAYKYATIIHPSAVIGSDVSIGAGTVIMPQVVINAKSYIGQHSILNSGAVVEHDNRLESYVHISPKAALAGNVTVGEGTHIGIGASLIPGVQVGSWSIIGAGSVVLSDIPASCTAVGVPARSIKFHEK